MVFGRLSIVHSDGRQATLTLEKPTVRIGSAADNTIILNDPAADPYHAQLLCDTHGCQILDLSSNSGTSLDGQRLPAQQPRQLANGNVIQIGNTRITISLGASPGRGAATGKLGPRPQDQDLLTSLLGAPVAGNGRTRTTPALGTAQPAINVAPTQPIAPPVVLPPQLHLSLSLADMTLDAGGTVMMTVTIVNSSKIVDRIEILVEGLPAAWVKIVPPSHSLYPGTKGETQIVITPPRAPTSTAHTYIFSVVAQSEQRPADRITESAELTILPYSDFRLDPLEPKEQTAWMRANYTLQVANRGNQDQSYEFQGANDQDAFIFHTIPAPFVVGPGSTGQARLTTRLRFLRWFGKPQAHQFTVSATPADASAPTQQVAGRFIQNPPLPPWLLILLAALLLLSLLGCCGYFFGPRLYALLFNRSPAPQGTVVPTTLGTETAPTSPVTTPSLETPAPLPTPDVAALLAKQAAEQAAAIAAQNAAFNQTATAIGGANSATQAAFAQSVMQTQTAQTNNFAQTQTTGAINIAQTQTAVSIANAATGTAQANIIATATAAATAQQQTQTAQAIANVTLTAQALAAQQTATALALTPVIDPATLTALATSFSQTQTAQSVYATQTALAIPTITPTNTPEPTLTPTPTPEADIIIRPSATQRTPIPGNAFVNQNVLFCFYHRNSPLTEPADGEPDCNPRGFNLILKSTIDSPDVASALDGLIQDRPFVYPAGIVARDSPSAALTSEFGPCGTYTYGCDTSGGPVPNAIGVFNFPTRSVANVTLNFWLPPDINNSGIGTIYFLVAYDGEGNKVAEVNTGSLTVPALYTLTVQSTSSRIQQVQIRTVTQRNDVPLFITALLANYSP